MSDSKKKIDATSSAPANKVGSVSSDQKSLEATDFLQSGWRVAIALLAPSFLGIWLDGRAGDGRVFTVIGVIAGIILANLVAYRYTSKRFYGGKND